jgi:hypothetical protein
MENDRINKAFADTLVELTRVSMSRLRGVALGEAMTLNSVTELSPSNQFLKDLVARQAKSLADMAAAASLELLKTAGHVASDFGMEPLVITQTREEREKSAMVPVLTESRKGMGLGIIDERLSKISDAAKERYKVSGFIEREEAAKCINGKNSLLDIKYILDSQRDEETKLKDLENFFRQMESAGMIKM